MLQINANEPRQHPTSKTVSAKRRRNRRRFLNENKPTIVTTAGTPPRTRAQASARTNTFTQARPLTIKRTATCTHRQTHARNADDSFVFRRVAAKCVSRAHIQTHHEHARRHTTAHKQPPTNNTLNTPTEYTHIHTRGETSRKRLSTEENHTTYAKTSKQAAFEKKPNTLTRQTALMHKNTSHLDTFKKRAQHMNAFKKLSCYI